MQNYRSWVKLKPLWWQTSVWSFIRFASALFKLKPRLKFVTMTTTTRMPTTTPVCWQYLNLFSLKNSRLKNAYPKSVQMCFSLFRHAFYNLVYGAVMLVLVCLLFYMFWRWCCENEPPKSSGSSEKLFMKPVYAHEIEPGIVVLQSENGDYFKILKEYDVSNRYGSVSCTRPEALQPSAVNLERSVMSTSGYTPSAFNPPSAPLLINPAPGHDSNSAIPPPYEAY